MGGCQCKEPHGRDYLIVCLVEEPNGMEWNDSIPVEWARSVPVFGFSHQVEWNGSVLAFGWRDETR